LLGRATVDGGSGARPAGNGCLAGETRRTNRFGGRELHPSGSSGQAILTRKSVRRRSLLTRAPPGSNLPASPEGDDREDDQAVDNDRTRHQRRKIFGRYTEDGAIDLEDEIMGLARQHEEAEAEVVVG